jgi:hypothetical protein
MSLVVAGAAVLLNAYLLDGIGGWFLSGVGAAPTEFSIGYSVPAFRRVKKGMTTEEVRQIFGAPLFVVITYSNGTSLAFQRFRDKPYIDGIGWKDSRISKEDARREFGEPRSEGWSYGKSPTTSPYSVRLVRFERERVVDVVHTLGGI